MTRPERQGIDDAVAQFLNSFQKPAKLLVAVSGGGDSVGLLIALDQALETQRWPGFSLVACTIDHALREGSAEEARWVADLCVTLGIVHVTRRWDGPKPSYGIQAAAREARYELLADAARSQDAEAILTAHNRDDQHETISMRSSRRNDGAGLAGIPPATLFSRSIWVLRPLLGVVRKDIRDYLNATGQGWLEDPSNINRKFERVRVREEGADLEATGLKEAVQARMESARNGAAFLFSDVRVFDSSLAHLQPAALEKVVEDGPRWQALVALVAVLGGRKHRLEADAQARVRDFLDAGTLSRITAGRVVFDRRSEGLFLYRESRGVGLLEIEPYGEAIWDDRWRVTNLGRSALKITAAAEVADGHLPQWDGVPAGVVKRAALARPIILSGGSRAPARSYKMSPAIDIFDRYLPVFDLPLANALSELFGAGTYPAPPSAWGATFVTMAKA